MAQRLRHLLAALAASAAVLTTTVFIAAPASADPGTTCLAPSVSGTLSLTDAYRGGQSLRVTGLTGSTSANCQTSTREFKYEVTVNNPATLASGTAYSSSVTPALRCVLFVCSWNGTAIAFGNNASVAYAGSFDVTAINILTYSRYPGLPWPTEPSNFQWYKLTELGAFNTSGMQQVSLASCPSHVFRSGCP